MAELPPLPRTDADDDGNVGMGSLLWVAGRGAPAPNVPKRGGFEAAEILVGPSASAVLRRLVDEDPLRLSARCSEFLRAKALLIDLERMLARLFAQVARESMKYDGQPPLDSWLAALLDEIAEELLNEDVQMLRGDEQFPENDEVPHLLAAAFGIQRADALRAAVTFNALPEVERHDVYAVALERTSIQDRATHRGVSIEVVQSSVARALASISISRCSEMRIAEDPS